MYIIFDLDDTLIDTSGTVTPKALEYALNHVSVDAPLSELLEINRSAYSSAAAWKQLLKRYNAEDYLEKALEAMNRAPMDAIAPVPGAIALLSELAQHHRMAIVTVGNENRQHEKIQRAGINKEIFEFIEIVPDHNKKNSYQKLLTSWHVDPFNILVVGDRVTTDLQPAKELGMRTCHIEWGRGQNNTGSKRVVDVTINALNQVEAIAHEYQNYQ